MLQLLFAKPQHCFAVGGDKGPPSSTYTGCQPEDVYLIQYTSGATGTPKPVVVTAGAAAHNVRAARKAYDLDLSTIFVSWLPQYHDCGLMFLLLTIVSGATCVLTSPSAFVQRPLLWLELISKYQATCTPVPAFALPLVARRGGPCLHKLDLRSLRNLVLINEPIYDSDVQDFLKVFADAGLHPSAIAPSYGLAENCTFVSTAWAPGGVPSFPDIPVHAQLLPSARLGSYDIDVDVHIVVVDEETFEQVEDGREGEIWVSSESNANGYLGQPWLSHEVFNCRLKGGVGRRFIRTGDRGIVLGHQRFLFVTGRCRDMIRSHDRTVHAHYLETRAYKSHPECLRGGCIAAFQVQNGEDQVVAIIAELQKGKDKGALSLVRICKGIQGSLFKEYGLEVGLVGLVKGGSLPKTSSGKMQRWAAKEKLARRELEVVQLVWFGKSCGSSGKGRAESLGPLNGPSMKYNGVHESRDWMLSYPHITSLL
ncbi:hypothetical protein AMTR_s00011p00254800 [Amborella trichopoda]|uniref:AMP-dependent synthetase/ligase domain-containing protein n=1 Tax=Amborella trichopoda TaxID=13333 RepID=W1NHV2_AMBTC|nr:hypothetical protein AMTR_s00011p00254800 [Amborella trichopoda]